MPQRLRRYSPKLAVAFFVTIAATVAQDPTSYLSPSVMRVGEKLACRCGGCRNTVGSCPMLHCHSADPLRRRIAEMLGAGMTDAQVVNKIVESDGVVALAAPPTVGWGLFTWIMPAVALLIGFFVYSRWVRRNRPQPVAVSEADRALLEKYRAQIERDFGEDEEVRK